MIPHALRIVWPPHVDYLRVVGDGAPGDFGFQPRERRWWRPGWNAVERTGYHGRVQTWADAEPGSRWWPQAHALDMHPTRVDVACDVTGGRDRHGRYCSVTFNAACRTLFAGRGARTMVEKRGELCTLYLGSRVSPLMLRIYNKSAGPHTDADCEVWRRHGWDGRTPVWRIEYEFHTRALAAWPDLQLPRDVGLLWADGLARIRMCDQPPTRYAEQNKAPTHPWWRALGDARRATRCRARGDVAEDEVKTTELMRRFGRLLRIAGPRALAAMAAKLSTHAPRA